MSTTIRRAQDIWREQCEATQGIQERSGLQAGFDYLVAEKRLNSAAAATDHPEFTRELPSFVAEVRRIFHAHEVREHLARIEGEERERASIQVEDDIASETPHEAASRRERYATIKVLLIEPRLGIARATRRCNERGAALRQPSETPTFSGRFAPASCPGMRSADPVWGARVHRSSHVGPAVG